MAEKRGLFRRIALLLDPAAARKFEQDAQRSLDKATDAKPAEQNLSRVGAGMERLRGMALKLGAVFAAVFAVRKIRDFGEASVKAAIVSEQAWSRLAGSIENAGERFPELEKRLRSAASEFERLTTHDDDDFAAVLGDLVQYSGDAEKSLRNVAVVADLAAAKQLDLRTAAQLVGRAMIGETGTLKRYGVNVQEGADAVEVMRKQFEGLAYRETRTLGGQLEQLNVQWGNFKKAVGFVIIESGDAGSVLDTLTASVRALAGWVDQNRESLVAFGGKGVRFAVSSLVGMYRAVMTLGNALATVLLGSLSGVTTGLSWLVTGFAKARGAAAAFWRAIGADDRAARAQGEADQLNAYAESLRNVAAASSAAAKQAAADARRHFLNTSDPLAGLKAPTSAPAGGTGGTGGAGGEAATRDKQAEGAAAKELKKDLDSLADARDRHAEAIDREIAKLREWAEVAERRGESGLAAELRLEARELEVFGGVAKELADALVAAGAEAPQMADAFRAALDGVTPALEGASQAYDEALAEIREKQARGLISEEDAREQGARAAAAFNAEVLRALDQLREQGVAPQLIAKIQAELKVTADVSGAQASIAEVASSIAGVARGLLSIADAVFGGLDDATRQGLEGVVNLADGIAKMASGDVIGGAIQAIGGLIDAIKGFFGGGASDELKRLRRESNASMRALVRALDELRKSFRRDISRTDVSADLAMIERANRYGEEQAQGWLKGERKHGIGSYSSKQGLTQLAQTLGLTTSWKHDEAIGSLKDYTRGLDERYDTGGALTAFAEAGDLAGLLAAFKELGITLGEIDLSSFGQDLQGRLDAMRFALSALGDSAGDAAAQMERFLSVIRQFSPQFAEDLERLYKESPEEALKYVQDLAERFASGGVAAVADVFGPDLTAEEVQRLLEDAIAFARGAGAVPGSGGESGTQSYQVTRSITEVTGSRLVGYLATITYHVARIADWLLGTSRGLAAAAEPPAPVAPPVVASESPVEPTVAPGASPAPEAAEEGGTALPRDLQDALTRLAENASPDDLQVALARLAEAMGHDDLQDALKRLAEATGTGEQDALTRLAEAMGATPYALERLAQALGDTDEVEPLRLNEVYVAQLHVAGLQETLARAMAAVPSPVSVPALSALPPPHMERGDVSVRNDFSITVPVSFLGPQLAPPREVGREIGLGIRQELERVDQGLHVRAVDSGRRRGYPRG